MRLNTDGVVIKSINVGESDRLITILTRKHGIVNAFVRGARKLKGGTISSTQLFSYSEFAIFVKGDKYIVDEALSIKNFFKFGNEISRLSLAYYFAELSTVLSPQNDNAECFLRLLLNSLNFLIDVNYPMLKLKAIFELRIVSLAGYMPNLLACEKCGCFESEKMYFHPENGQLFCGDCQNSFDGMLVEKGTLTAMRHIIYSEFEKLFSFNLSENSYKKLSVITEKYLFMQTQRTYQTLDFYKTMAEF